MVLKINTHPLQGAEFLGNSIQSTSVLLEISLENFSLGTPDKHRSTDQQESPVPTNCLVPHRRQGGEKKEKEIQFCREASNSFS